MKRMQSLVLSGNFRELSQDELYEVNGGVGKLLLGNIAGTLIGAVHAGVRGDCVLTGAGKGAVKGTFAAVAKVAAIAKWPAKKLGINIVYYGHIGAKAGWAASGW